MFTYNLSTYKKNTFVNITSYVRDSVKISEIQNGIACIFSPHTTAGITINENADPDVMADMNSALEKAVPNVDFTHMEENSPSHFKTLLTGNSVTVPISGGTLALGTWQGIYFCEYDGPRNRKFYVNVMGV